ncbi:MAG: hypothetical protein U0T82_06375 [Bacteroidales bacterium]
MKLFYNEYRSRAEYILSNVPMQVDQHGEILPMVSGGMFDISATDMSGRPLAIRSGKEIRLQFVPANPLSNMFLWYRDTVTQSWQNLRSLQSYRPLFIANSFKSDTSIFPCKEVYFSEFQSRLSNLYWADKFYSNLGDTSTPPLKIFTQTNTSTSIKVDQFCKSIKKINQKTKFTIIPDKVEYITLNFMKSKSMNDLAKKGQYKIIYPNNPQLQSNLMGKIWEDYTLALNDSLLCFTLFEEGHIYQMVLSARYKGMMSSKNRIEKTAALLKSLTRKVNFNRTSQNKKYKEFLPIIKKDYPDSSWSDLFDRLAFAFSYNLAEKHHGEDTLSLESWLGFAFAHREYFNKRSISIRKNISVTAKDTRDIIMSNLEKIMLHPMNEAEFALHTDSLIRVYSELICLMNRYPSIPLNELKDTHLSHQNLKKLILKYETKPKIEQLLGIQVSEEFFFSHLDSFLIVYDMAISRRNAILANNPRGQQEERDALDYLKIQKFGIFNCDQISRLKSPKKLNAVYTTGKGELIDIVSIYLVDRLINSVLIFNGYNNLGPYNFSYSPSSNNSLLAFDADGKAWYCENDEFLKISGNKHTFVLKPVPKLKDRDALAEFIK